MSKKIIALALFFVTGSSQAILLERSAQGQYNHSSQLLIKKKPMKLVFIHKLHVLILDLSIISTLMIIMCQNICVII